MNWEVTWISECYEQLEAIWQKAEDKGSITRAAIRIDRLLSTDPIQNSESREFNQRIILELPLVVIFLAEPEISLITVIEVRCVNQR